MPEEPNANKAGGLWYRRWHTAMTEVTRLEADKAVLVEALEGDLDWLDALSQMTIERDTAMARIKSHRALIAKVQGDDASNGLGGGHTCCQPGGFGE